VSLETTPDDLRRYSLALGEPDKQGGTRRQIPRWCNHWRIVELYLSDACFCVRLRPSDESKLHEAHRQGDPDGLWRSAKSELRAMMRFIRQTAHEYRPISPLVALIELQSEGTPASGSAEGGRDDDGECGWGPAPTTLARLRGWSGDQDWHRGDFALYAVQGPDEAIKRLRDLLQPLPEGWVEQRTIEARELSQIIQAVVAELRSKAATKTAESSPDPAPWLEAVANGLTGPPAEQMREELEEAGLGHWLGELFDRELERRTPEEERSLLTSLPRQPFGAEVLPKRSRRDDDGLEVAEDAVRIGRLKRFRVEDFRAFGPAFPGVCRRAQKEAQQEEPACASEARGWLDLDADIVLLTGPNGTGKTSLIEALTLALTGHHFHGRDGRSPDEVLFHVYPRSGGSDPAPAEHCCIEVDARAPEDPAGTIRITTTMSRGEPRLHREAHAAAGGELERVDAPSELQARLCTFLADRLEVLFDETTEGRTVRDVYEPLPPLVAAFLSSEREELERHAEKLITQLGTRLEALERADIEEIQRRASEVIDRLRGSGYGLMAELNTALPALPEGVASHALRSLAVELMRNVSRGRALEPPPQPDDLKEALLAARRGVIRTAVEGGADGDAVGERLAELQGERDEVSSHIERLEKEHGSLEAFERATRAFDAPRGSELPGLREVLLSLRDHRDRWLEARPHLEEEGLAGHLDLLFSELERVRASDAGELAEELAAYLAPREEVLAEWRGLPQRLKELNEALRAAKLSERLRVLVQKEPDFAAAAEALAGAWRDLDQAEQRAERIEALGRRRAELEALQAAVKAIGVTFEEVTGPSKELQRKLQKRLDGVYRRFVHGGGEAMEMLLHAVHREASGSESPRRAFYRLEAKDGRVLQMLSAGQRSQLGVAFMLAQNIMANEAVTHRTLLVDDVSATYDMANLARECVFWRQIAYAADEGLRRQLILSSHHEDLTNLLLEALVPPHGRRMLVYRFRGWTQEHGPVVEGWEVLPFEEEHEPDGEAPEPRGFGGWMKEQICTSYV